MKFLAALVGAIALVGAGCEFETHENMVATCSATNSGWEVRLSIYRDSDQTSGDVVGEHFSEICDLMQVAVDELPIEGGTP